MSSQTEFQKYFSCNQQWIYLLHDNDEKWLCH